jgi:UDP-glucuronate 4-epimerase
MQQSKMAVTGQPIKVFNNGNMPAPVKYEVNFTGPVPWTRFSPPGVRDFTYVDDIVEGVTRVIDSPPAPGPLDARVPDSVTPDFQERSELKVKGGTNPDGNREGGTTEGTSSPQHNVTSKNSSPPGRLGGASSPVPLMEYIASIEKTLGKEAQKEFLPMQPGDVPRTEADVTDLMKDLNYKPNTPVQIGIENFISWYKSYFGIQ